MGQLEDMRLFVRIVETGGIGKAANELNLAKSAVSRRLSDLENRLSTQLIARTTRRFNLTDAGTLYYQQALGILDDVSAMNARVTGTHSELEGRLKITIPLSFGLMHLTPVLDAFTKRHPGLTLNVDFSDRHIDLIEEGYEMAIRISRLQATTLRARPITRIRHVFCASPEYLKRNNPPITPAELEQHAFLQYGLVGWNKVKITDSQGQSYTVNLDGKIKSNNGDFLRDMAINGQGITYLPTFLTYQAVSQGQLVTLMDDYQKPEINAYAVYPQTRFLSRGCRALIDFLVSSFGDQPYWDTGCE